MPSPSERDSWLYVEDMRMFCERVLEYNRGVERHAFAVDGIPQRRDQRPWRSAPPPAAGPVNRDCTTIPAAASAA